MTALDYGRVRCSNCGTWYGLDESHTCPKAAVFLAASPVLPTDLPWDPRPGTTVRSSVREALSVDEQFRLHLEAVLNHPAETVVRRPVFAKEYQL